MILKHHNSIETTDKLLQSGNSAEKQMAFYLQGAFGDDENFHILNGTRLKKGEDVCQIDHLVVHTYGMAIVESKSVTSKVKINDDGSWERIWDNHWQGMRSPVIQAKMQADFLRNYLNFHKEQVLMKVRGVQQTFDKMPIEVIVAISDSGIIDRSGHPESKFVYKADQVTSKIKEIHAEQKRLDKILTLSLKMPTWVFLKEAQERISRFIVEAHRPTAAPAPPAKKQDAQTKGTYSVKYVASLKMAGFFFDKNSSGKKISEFFQRQFFPGFLIQIIWKTCSCLVAVHGSPAVRADIEVV